MRNIDLGFQTFRRRPARKRIAGGTCKRRQIEQILPHPDCRLAVFCGIDEQGRKAREMLRARLDGIYPTPLALVEVGRRQQIADRKNPGERRADLMRERRQRRLDHAGCGGDGGAFASLADGHA